MVGWLAFMTIALSCDCDVSFKWSHYATIRIVGFSSSQLQFLIPPSTLSVSVISIAVIIPLFTHPKVEKKTLPPSTHIVFKGGQSSFILMLESALPTSWHFTPHTNPLLGLSMSPGSLTNGSFACHAPWMLWVWWVWMSIITLPSNHMIT